MQNFRDTFPETYTLLTAWFADDGKDNKVIKEFISEESAEMQKKVIEEGKALLNGEEKYRKQIGDLANRAFDNQQQSEEWLQNIIVQIEKNTANS
ncbi:contact-dependent growth inhibition system immunity protein [Candidatus Uabimicrobium amorphum]|uniref:Uncharacterized protein n=1 Tax=Uabimicrobium amorphum TaxID=2596890 RepID=A0A5S9IMN2_UABAM|nr:contact-dependent growth inhibition system immunity protein [Candidatus Uabimicrobium amorphum]BBM84713.1 hypothetical protein UABAM_03074 [Candidatus Uabimicrobium amorphum]